ncbi:hypothetical protein [uncultured Pontibacter sp.]|uniref:hypothetical protein n=1 Tax=uncultured Pontibacter sp. TaxID=453356 RepID=UPI002637C047|nr:hypothetical protein [uncultured Pontibacter sp.]
MIISQLQLSEGEIPLLKAANGTQTMTLPNAIQQITQASSQAVDYVLLKSEARGWLQETFTCRADGWSLSFLAWKERIVVYLQIWAIKMCSTRYFKACL